MQQKQIAQVYDLKASEYNADRRGLADNKYVKRFEEILKPQSLVLDLGCGDGSAVAAPLLKLNHLAIGLDISPVQIDLAQKNCPRGEFICRDISSLKSGEYQVDGVTALYSIFHIPRDHHVELLKIIASFLSAGGVLLVTMGDRNFEGWHDFYGAKVWSSHFGPQTNARLVREAGFQIILDELHTSNRETHQVILATKI